MRGVRPVRAAIAAAAVTTVATGALAFGAAAANAAPAPVYYWADGPTGLVVAKLVGTKVTGVTTVMHTSNSQRDEPTTALGSFGAGVVYNFSSSTPKQTLYTYDRRTKTFRTLTSAKTDSVVSAALFNSGKSVAYIDQSLATKVYTLRVKPSTGGRAVVKYTAPKSATLTGIAAAPSGKVFYLGENVATSGHMQTTVYSYTVATRTLHRLAQFTNGYVKAMALSPNGATLAYGLGTFPPPKQGIALVKVGTGGLNKTVGYYGDPATISWSATGGSLMVSDETANGWTSVNTATGKSTAMDFNSTGHYTFPVRV